jgi:hypothetical protein
MKNDFKIGKSDLTNSMFSGLDEFWLYNGLNFLFILKIACKLALEISNLDKNQLEMLETEFKLAIPQKILNYS